MSRTTLSTREEIVEKVLREYRNGKRRLLSEPAPSRYKHLVGVNRQREGVFVAWGATEESTVLTRQVFREIVAEAEAAELEDRFHVHAALASYSGPGLVFHAAEEDGNEP